MSNTRKRPFSLYYGETTRAQIDSSNYHVRSRVTNLIAAVRAATTRIHCIRDAARVDVYDINGWHVATISARGTGIDIKFTEWAYKQYRSELRDGAPYKGLY